MTIFELHPLDAYEARFKMIATLVLLSELSVIEARKIPSEMARASDAARSRPMTRTARGGSQLVRPPRSC